MAAVTTIASTAFMRGDGKEDGMTILMQPYYKD
jgi:hypothetical protein